MKQSKIFKTDRAPAAIGPYSQAVGFGHLVYTAGQLGIDPKTSSLVHGGIKEQTRQVLENLKAVLKASGSGLEQVLKTTVFLKDLGDFAAMNEVYATYFTKTPPARSTIGVAALPKDALVEIDAVGISAEE